MLRHPIGSTRLLSHTSNDPAAFAARVGRLVERVHYERTDTGRAARDLVFKFAVGSARYSD